MVDKSCFRPLIQNFIFTAITLQNGTLETIFLKNCGKTLDYHATGCLNIDNADDGISFTGSLCYCETDNCNVNFDPNEPKTTTPATTTKMNTPATTSGIESHHLKSLSTIIISLSLLPYLF